HADLLGELGVARHIDYTASRFEDETQPADVVFDTIGGDTFLRSFDVLRDGGTLVSIAYFDEPPADLVERKRLRVRQFSMRPDRTRLETLARMVAQGELRPVIGTLASLDDAIAAIRRAMRGHNQGNIVISMLQQGRVLGQRGTTADQSHRDG
ncbi:MAG TPA: zinc-binding dehydrogenase, partial [Thermomicrobiales bacterium]|nr:zinc-binding dehydrogenase [Thermomicrobiales bacterium]